MHRFLRNLTLLVWLSLTPAAMAETHYEVLGLTPTATPAEIKAAFQKLSRENHPDTKPGDAAALAKYIKVVEAGDVLRDEERRKTYDASLRSKRAEPPKDLTNPEGRPIYEPGTILTEATSRHYTSQYFRVIRTLGSGHFGAVFLVQEFHKENGREVAGEEKVVKLSNFRPWKRGTFIRDTRPFMGAYSLLEERAGKNWPDSVMKFEPNRGWLHSYVGGSKEMINQHPFVFLERAEHDLSKVIADTRLEAGASPAELERRLANVELFASQGLEAATDLLRMGLVHGDLKPANFFWVAQDQPARWKLGDLDEVRRLGHTATFSVLFGAPEQFNNTTDVSTDLFGLAATIHAAVFGTSPYESFLLHEGRMSYSDLLPDRVVELVSSPERYNEFLKFVEKSYDSLAAATPAHRERIAQLKSLVMAGLQHKAADRVSQLSRIPAPPARALAREMRTVWWENHSPVVAWCKDSLSQMGLARAPRIIRTPRVFSY